MRASIFFFAFALFALASAQTTNRFLIDDFTVNQGQNITIILPAAVQTGGARVIQGNTFFRAGCGSGLIGCGRNMRIEVIAGEVQRQFTSQIFPSNTFPGVFTGEWDISNPKGGSSVSYNTYDGSNTNFNTINTSGLGGIDFTENGVATGLRFALISDLASTFTVDVYDTTGVSCTGTAQFNSLPGQTYTQDQITDDIPFTSFSGNCNFRSVGAVEVAIPSVDAVDAIVYQIRAVGFPDPSATPSQSIAPTQSNTPSQSLVPSQSPFPSQSNTPTPGPSQSQTPAASPSSSRSNTPAPSQSRTPAPSQSNTPAPSQSRTPTPSTSKQCSVVCNCPVFTCHLVYTFDTDKKDLFFN